jgi:CHAT domain-containing protein/Tfp pilus assembly protein PilF
MDSNKLVLRQFLLGEIADEDQRERIEKRLMTDDDYFEEFELVKEEVIDEYAEGEMSSKDRARFERHFLTTPDRQVSLQLANYLITEPPHPFKKKVAPKPGANPRESWLRILVATPLRTAASMAVVVAVALIAWNLVFRQKPSLADGLLALNEAYRQQRPIEARVSDFHYAPWTTTRGGDEIKYDRTARARAEALLHVAAGKDPDAAAHHALGKLALMNRQFDDAIGEFEEALKSDPNNARIHGDLGAAWLERGELESQKGEEAASFEGFGKSQTHLNRALEINPSLLEALFNRALVREHLKLFRLAEEDWKAYLEKDSTSPWADEARKKLKALQEKTNTPRADDPLKSFLSAHQNSHETHSWELLTQNRNYTGNLIENRLLDQYLAAATSARTDEARERFRVLTYAASLGTQHGDYFASDLVNFYATTSHKQQTALIEARRILALGHKLIGDDRTAEALNLYAEARKIFEQHGNSCEVLISRYTSAQAHLLQGESDESLSEFEYVKREAEAKRYLWLTGQTLNALANVHIGLNNYSLALELSNRSIKILEEVGDIVGVVKVNDQLGAEHVRLGEPREALRFHHRAVALGTENHLGVGPLWRSFFLGAMAFHALGLTATAIDFTKESLRFAESNKQGHLSVSRSCSNLGVMYGSTGQFDEAMSYFQRAIDSGNKVQTERVRLNALGYASLQMGHHYKLAGDFTRASDKYDEAIRLFDQLEFGAFSYVAHKGKFLACVSQLVVCPSVEQELQKALALYEAHRSKIIETKNRYSFFDNEQSVYDVAIDYEFANRNDKEKAFDYSEKCRARSLLNPANSPSHHVIKEFAEPDKLSTIRSEISADAQIVQYAVLADKLLIWVVSSTGFEGFSQLISAKSLEEKVVYYLQLISTGSSSDEEARRRAAAELYELLIKPVKGLLDKSKLICIVPDKILNRLPYPSLISPNGKYLIEDYTLTFALSSTMFVRWTKAAHQRNAPKPERLLSVGNPHFDDKTFPSFRFLPSAGIEAEQIAEEYESCEKLLTTDATEKRVVKAMENADVIHLATHAIVDEHSPMYSKLLLAISNEAPVTENNDGVLRASEIYQLNLPRARLVILSACQTGAEKYYGGEGMVGMWSPFITLKVPLVVASLWAVDSDSTKDLMINFHKLRRRGLSSAVALRQAQIEMLRGQHKGYQHPYHWSSFIAIGGHTQF